MEVGRFRLALERRATLAERLFTDGEREYGRSQHDPAESLAARFAAKEAVMKALGVGLGDFEFRDVEVRRADSGEPSLVLTGKARTQSPRTRRHRGCCRSSTPTPPRWRW